MKSSALNICLIIFLLIPSVAHAWDGKQDNKSVAELDLMTNKELAIEAYDVCRFGALYSSTNQLGKAIAARDYLTLIGRILRKRLNRELDSVEAMRLAVEQGIQVDIFPNDCSNALDKLNSEISKPTKPPKGK